MALANVLQELFNGENKLSKALDSRNGAYCSSVLHKIKSYFFGPYELLTIGRLGSKFSWKLNAKKNRHNAAVTPTIPKKFFKNIQTAYEANFSAVALALTGRALYKFMQEAGYEVPDTVSCSLARVVDSHPFKKLRNHV